MRPRLVAVIDEAHCIGCTLCIRACPFDAILGAPKQMHTVLTELCTGCDLCVAPCPVDCIALLPATGADAAWDRSRTLAARERAKARKLRLASDNAEREQRLAKRAPGQPFHTGAEVIIDAAIRRARARRGAAKAGTSKRHGSQS